MNIPLDCWDQSRALDSVGGDEEFLSELAGRIFPCVSNPLEKPRGYPSPQRIRFPIADTAQLLGHAAGNLAATRVSGSGACCRDDGSAQRPRWHRERLPRATAGGATSSGCAWRFQKRTIWISGDAKTAEVPELYALGISYYKRAIYAYRKTAMALTDGADSRALSVSVVKARVFRGRRKLLKTLSSSPIAPRVSGSSALAIAGSVNRISQNRLRCNAGG